MDKSKKLYSTIDAYIKNFPDDVQTKLNELREFIKKLVPEAEEIISFQIPNFKLNGKALLYFAAYKVHIGSFPFPSGIEKFKKESSKFVTFKGTVQFLLDKSIPIELMRKIV